VVERSITRVIDPRTSYASRRAITSRLIPQMKTDSSWAIAAAMMVGSLPLRMNDRMRPHNRVWAFHANSRPASVRQQPLAASPSSRAEDADNSKPPPRGCVARAHRLLRCGVTSASDHSGTASSDRLFQTFHRSWSRNMYRIGTIWIRTPRGSHRLIHRHHGLTIASRSDTVYPQSSDD
jgi:hypothetical protein